MNILFIGDIVGSVGRQMVKNHLSSLKSQYQIDLTIANGENSAHGKGITSKIYYDLINQGVDYITMGNHTFSKGELLTFIHEAKRLVRPENMAPTNLGMGVLVVKVKDKDVAIINLCAKVWMDNVVESPFVAMEKILNRVQADVYFVDFHGETTSEKIAFAQHFKKRCTAVVGTHTHVQTADERLIEGCAFISDAGMCGVYDSILGRDIEEVLQRFVYDIPTHYTIATGEGMFNGVVIRVDEETNRATSIERIQIRPTHS